MKSVLTRGLAALSAATCFTGLVTAGVVIQYESSGAGQAGSKQAYTAYVEKDRLRIDGDPDAIFRADKQVLWLLDTEKGTYQQMDAEQMKKVGSQVEGAMAEMERQLANLPPEQRKMAEQMMQGKMPGKAPGGTKKAEPRRIYRNTGKTETINGWPCVAYDANRGGEREQVVWVTDWKHIGLTADDFTVFQDFAAFLEHMAGPMAKSCSMGFDQKLADKPSPDALPGVPIRTISFDGGKELVTEVKKIAREPVPAAKFELPSGLKKDAMASMGD